MANRRRPIKKTKAFSLDVADEEYIKEIAEQHDTVSDSEALRIIIREHKASFFSEALASMQDLLQSNQPADATA